MVGERKEMDVKTERLLMRLVVVVLKTETSSQESVINGGVCHEVRADENTRDSTYCV